MQQGVSAFDSLDQLEDYLRDSFNSVAPEARNIHRLASHQLGLANPSPLCCSRGPLCPCAGVVCLSDLVSVLSSSPCSFFLCVCL